MTAPVAVSARCARCDATLEVRCLTTLHHQHVFTVRPCPRCDPEKAALYDGKAEEKR